MPEPATSLTAATVALLDEALLDAPATAAPADLAGEFVKSVVTDLAELLAQPHLPTADVAYATGALGGALARAGCPVTAPLLNDGRDHSDVLHWPDGLGRTWVLRIVGQVL